MSWELDRGISLQNDRVPAADALRQQRTAAEILRRFDRQPGLVLADEVGMGKTFVALAVAVSVIEATKRKRPVVVMVPEAVSEKWPKEWAVFADRCIAANHGIRTAGPVRRGSEFLALLDDPPDRRRHLIFMSHGALTRALQDPFVGLALLRQATSRRADLLSHRRYVARWAGSLLNDRRLRDEALVGSLLDAPPARWRGIWNAARPDAPLDDDPVPFSFLEAVRGVDLDELRQAVLSVPKYSSASLSARLRRARRELTRAIDAAWTDALCRLDVHLPLLILDEAHHVRNETRLGRLFANEEAERDAEALRGPLGNMFERMLFLTATPFQLGHAELMRVLRRFEGVRWPSAAARSQFTQQIDDLGRSLDRAQGAALRLERAWSRLGSEDVPHIDRTSADGSVDAGPERVRVALEVAKDTADALDAAEALLQPWVIRHLKTAKAERRRYLAGRAILGQEHDGSLGIAVGGAATLPFLLAARAQAITALGQDDGASTRAYFAYGLASSFEAYADTRRNRVAALDDLVAEASPGAVVPQRLRWYLDRIATALPEESVDGWASHPKVSATVQRVVDLWRHGEKALVFCFYVETGRALRAHISRALQDEIVRAGARKLGIDDSDGGAVLTELGRVSERLLRADTSAYEGFRKRVVELLAGLDNETSQRLADAVVRFMRTPSFLVRYVDVSSSASSTAVLDALDQPDASGLTLCHRITAFGQHVGRLVEYERDELFTALEGVQTGAIGTTTEDFDPSERARSRETLLPNVRLANGGVRAETRRRLMVTFNTPFFPEVLVASSVMAEGVDLHLDCRHVIHHDLDWNPSTLEQRTGRVDRIGSKAERAGRPLVVYEPYLAGTHDEKMFRVVKDRERWFGVVMGDQPDSSEWGTERRAARIPLPDHLAQLLTLDLSVAGPS